MTTEEYNKGVEMYADNIYRFVIKHTNDEEKSADIVQDSFEKLWKNRKTVDPKKVRSWLFSTAYNRMIDIIRKEKRIVDFETVSTESYSHTEQYSDMQEVLHEALDTLPDIQKSVVLLRDYEGYSYKEIAEMTKLSESQVKVYIFRARVALKNYLCSIETLV